MEYNADNVQLSARTNDDLNLNIAGVTYDITLLPIKFKLQNGVNVIDLSTNITKTSISDFSIHIKASDLETIGAIRVPFDIYVDLGAGSKDFLLSGIFTITRGIV